ncbi:MAG: sigma-E processing peptidase SpoIIGA, partial [Clostridia bacterium]|nr:sigma-E processing peptidase SpoIIGA [Clostridia bacterium]
MTIYIEYVIIDNFVFDYILLLLALKSKAKIIKKRRVLLSASFGTFFAIIFPFLYFNEIVLFGLKILIAFCMIAIADKFEDFKDYFIKVNKFIFLTFSFGGIIYGFMSLVGLKYDFLYTTTNSAVPLGIMIVCAVVLY